MLYDIWIKERTWADFDNIKEKFMVWCFRTFQYRCRMQRDIARVRDRHVLTRLEQEIDDKGTRLIEVVEVKTQLDILRDKWSNPHLKDAYERLPDSMRSAVDATVMSDREPDDAASYLQQKPQNIRAFRYRGLCRIANEITDGELTKPIPLPSGAKPGRQRRTGNIHPLEAVA